MRCYNPRTNSFPFQHYIHKYVKVILSFPFQHIKTWMSAVGWMVEEDSFYEYTPYGNRHFSNVIATLSPGKSHRVVLACHYDSKLMPTVRFVGATDSAVPCSLLMDSAFRLRSFFQATKNSSSVSMAVYWFTLSLLSQRNPDQRLF